MGTSKGCPKNVKVIIIKSLKKKYGIKKKKENKLLMDKRCEILIILGLIYADPHKLSL